MLHNEIWIDTDGKTRQQTFNLRFKGGREPKNKAEQQELVERFNAHRGKLRQEDQNQFVLEL